MGTFVLIAIRRRDVVYRKCTLLPSFVGWTIKAVGSQGIGKPSAVARHVVSPLLRLAGPHSDLSEHGVSCCQEGHPRW